MSQWNEQQRDVLYKELADYIKEKQFLKGVEIGVNACRCLSVCLDHNPELFMVGMDLWGSQPELPFEDNASSEAMCRDLCAPYNNRLTLLKGDAGIIGKGFAARQFDFVFYDCYTHLIEEPEYHMRILGLWLKKLKSGGHLLGCDFHTKELSLALDALELKDVSPIIVNGKASNALKFTEVWHKN